MAKLAQSGSGYNEIFMESKYAIKNWEKRVQIIIKINSTS